MARWNHRVRGEPRDLWTPRFGADNLMWMDWDDLRFVLAVRRHGTLSAAATALGVTRTTVGRRLREAEGRLGVRLFDRTPDGLVPTVAGDDLSGAAERVEEEVLATEARLLGRDAALRGRLRVSLVDFVFEAFPDVFASFVQRYPRIDLTLHVSNEPASLMRREADVALRMSHEPAEHLVGRRLGRIQFNLYGARTLVETIGADAPLAAFPFLHWDERLDGRWLDMWIAEHAAGARVALRTSHVPSLHRAVRSGIGVHLLPACLGDCDPDLLRLGPELAGQEQDLWALTLPELRGNSRIRAFLEHAFEAFKPHRAAMLGVRPSELNR